jgi:hypothetical protein
MLSALVGPAQWTLVPENPHCDLAQRPQDLRGLVEVHHSRQSLGNTGTSPRAEQGGTFGGDFAGVAAGAGAAHGVPDTVLACEAGLGTGQLVSRVELRTHELSCTEDRQVNEDPDPVLVSGEGKRHRLGAQPPTATVPLLSFFFGGGGSGV